MSHYNTEQAAHLTYAWQALYEHVLAFLEDEEESEHGYISHIDDTWKAHDTTTNSSPAGASSSGSLLVLLLVTGCTTLSTSSSDVPAPMAGTQTLHEQQVHLAPEPAFSTSVRSAHSRLFTFAPFNVGLMQPAVDAQGQVWVGEMHANRLGRLNVRTGVVSSWQPPGGRYGIMTTTVDAQGDIWFAELYANYLGRFDPKQQTFRLFPLGTWQGNPLGPQDLHVDVRGRLWFTATEAGALGRLDPSTGALRLWSLPSSPSTLTLTPSGRVWFGAAGAVGSLDPATDQIMLYHLPNQEAQVFSMALDTTGRIWFSEVLPGKLGMLDPVTGTFSELSVPTLWGGPPALYQLVLDHHGNVWCVDVGADALVRYAPGKHISHAMRNEVLRKLSALYTFLQSIESL